MIQNKSYVHTDMQKEYDVAIYDPPFGMWKDLVIVTKAKYHVCLVNEKNREYVENIFGKPDTVLIWHFNNGNSKNDYRPYECHQYILIYGKMNRSSYKGTYQHNTKPQNKGLRKKGKNVLDKPDEHNYFPNRQKQIKTVFNYPRLIKKGESIWTKPQILLFEILDWLTDEGDIIWDGFAGSGNVGVVAKKLGCSYEGYEEDKDTYKKALENIESATYSTRNLERLKIHLKNEVRKLTNMFNHMREIKKTITKIEGYIKNETN